MNKKVHANQLKKMRELGILSFPTAGQVLEEYADYQEDTKQFVYKKDAKEYFNPEAIIYENIKDYFEKCGLFFTPDREDHTFTT